MLANKKQMDVVQGCRARQWQQQMVAMCRVQSQGFNRWDSKCVDKRAVDEADLLMGLVWIPRI